MTKLPTKRPTKIKGGVPCPECEHITKDPSTHYCYRCTATIPDPAKILSLTRKIQQGKIKDVNDGKPWSDEEYYRRYRLCPQRDLSNDLQSYSFPEYSNTEEPDVNHTSTATVQTDIRTQKSGTSTGSPFQA